jgi:hypothetical protein
VTISEVNFNTHPQFFFQDNKLLSVCTEYVFCHFGSSGNTQLRAQELKEVSKFTALNNIDRLEEKLTW